MIFLLVSGDAELKKAYLLLLMLLVALPMCVLALQDSQGGLVSDWMMDGKNLDRTSWDGVPVTSWGNGSVALTNSISGVGLQQPHVVNGLVYVPKVGGFSRYYASNLSWVDDFRDPVAGGTIGNTPIVANGYVYFNNNLLVYQLLESNISVVVSQHAVGTAGFTATTMVMGLYGGSLYVGSGMSGGVGYFYDLNASNVSQQFSVYTLNNEVDFNPCIANGYVYFGGRNNIFYQVNASNVASLISSYTTGGQVANWGCVVSGGYVYVGSFDGYLYQFPYNSLTSYTARINLSTHNRIYTPVVEGGSLYVVSSSSISGDGILWRLNASNITQIFDTFTLPSAYGTGLRSPSVSNGVVYVPVRNYIYEVSAGNVGVSLRNISTGGVVPSPLALTSDSVYYYTTAGFLYQYMKMLPVSNVSFVNITPSVIYANNSPVATCNFGLVVNNNVSNVVNTVTWYVNGNLSGNFRAISSPIPSSYNYTSSIANMGGTSFYTDNGGGYWGVYTPSSGVYNTGLASQSTFTSMVSADRVHNVVYSYGAGLFVYNVSSNSWTALLGGTYDGVSVASDSANYRAYLGGGSINGVGSVFSVYNRNSNTWTNLSGTAVGNWWYNGVYPVTMRAVVMDNVHNLVYTGLDDGSLVYHGITHKFGVYNPATNVWTDLSGAEYGGWTGIYGVMSLAYDGVHNLVYTGMYDGKLGVYNVATGRWTYLASTGNFPYFMDYDSVHDRVYIVGQTSAKLGVYSPTFGYLRLGLEYPYLWDGSGRIQSVAYDSIYDSAYLGLVAGTRGGLGSYSLQETTIVGLSGSMNFTNTFNPLYWNTSYLQSGDTITCSLDSYVDGVHTIRNASAVVGNQTVVLNSVRLNDSSLTFGENFTILANISNALSVTYSVRNSTGGTTSVPASLVSGLWVSSVLSARNGSYAVDIFTNSNTFSNALLYNVTDKLFVNPTNFTGIKNAGQSFIFNTSIYHDSSLNMSFNFSLSGLNASYFLPSVASNPFYVVGSGNDLVTIAVAGGTPNGVYYGNMTIVRLFDNRTVVVPLTLGVASVYGIPSTTRVYWSTSIYSNNYISQAFTINNVGNYNLTGCSPSLNGDFMSQGFVGFSGSGFSIPVGGSYDLTLTFTNPTAGSYLGYMQLTCVATSGGLLNSFSNQPLVLLTSIYATPTGGGGGGGTPQTIIPTVTSGGLLPFYVTTDGSNIADLFMYPSQKRTQTFVVVSNLSTDQSLSVRCAGTMCPYVSLSKSSLTLVGYGQEFVVATLNLPSNTAYNSTFFYNLEVSDSASHTGVVKTTIQVSQFTKWWSKYNPVVSVGDVGYWFSVGNYAVPKLLLYLMLVLITELVAYMVLSKKESARDLNTVIFVFVGVLVFGLVPIIY